jgi:hypothetical protein
MILKNHIDNNKIKKRMYNYVPNSTLNSSVQCTPKMFIFVS